MYFKGIGIKSREDYRQYTIDIAKGKIRPTESDPKIWFESVESMAQILSTRNQELLRTIKENNPQSLTELATKSGRKISNLSRTLKSMERYGIISLSRDGGSVKLSVCVDTFNAVFGFWANRKKFQGRDLLCLFCFPHTKATIFSDAHT